MCKIKSFIVLLLATYFVSCNDDVLTEKNSDSKDLIQCEVQAPSFVSKGTPVDSEKDPLFNTFGLLGYETNDLYESSVDPKSLFMSNVKLEKNQETWNFGHKYYWPQSGYFSFFAYSPFASSVNGIQIESIQGKTPYLTYKLSHNVADQPDLMISNAEKNLYKQNIQLKFAHALACIGFDVSGENVPIDSIGIKGVYTSGTLMLGVENGVIDWQNLKGLSNDLFKVGLVDNPEATDPEKPVMATDGYLMMVPQKLTDDAAIVVKFKGIDPKVIPLKTQGTTEWVAGNKYIYSLKEGVYHFDVNLSQNDCSYVGGTLNLNIKSSYTTQNGLTRNLKWKSRILNISPDNTYWNSNFNMDSLNTYELAKTIHINVAPYTTDCAEDQLLKQADSIKYKDMKDLSFNNNSYSTSNCYVVNAPGWYKFPCWVMGNAIKNSSQPTAVNNTECISSESPYFQDYSGKDIQSVNDLTINTTNSTPLMIWSDSPDLVSDIRLSGDQRYVEFYVSPETIRQGNALIGLRKNGVILWSWQIWVTDWKLNTKNQVMGGTKPDLMPFAIGRCSAAAYNYQQRTITIRFTQDESNIERDIVITQNGDVVRYGENAPYYQWGRKDPMIASDGLGAVTKLSFGPMLFKTSASLSPVALNKGIQNPNIFYLSNVYPSNWSTPVNYELWGCRSKGQGGVKTIYDPSPVGYRVPELTTLLSFIRMGHKLVDSPIEGAEMSPDNTGIYSLFLASNGGRGAKDGHLFEAIVTKKQGFYWTNCNYYWGKNPAQSVSTFLNLIISASKDPQVYYQENPGASGLNVCPSVE